MTAVKENRVRFTWAIALATLGMVGLRTVSGHELLRPFLAEQADRIGKILKGRDVKTVRVETTGPKTASLDPLGITLILEEEFKHLRFAVVDSDPDVRVRVNYAALTPKAKSWKVSFTLQDKSAGPFHTLTPAQNDEALLRKMDFPGLCPLRIQAFLMARTIAKVIEQHKDHKIAVRPFEGPISHVFFSKLLIEELQDMKNRYGSIQVQTEAALSIRGEYDIDVDSTGYSRMNVSWKCVDRFGKVVHYIDPAGKKNGAFQALIRFDPTIPPASGGDDDQVGVLCVAVGFTGSIPAEKSPEKRHEETRKKPQAHLEGTRIKASKTSPYAVEVVVDGKTVQPRLENGRPVVHLEKDARYSLRIHNRDEFGAGVQVFVDGLSMFTFSENRDYRFMLIERKKGEEAAQGEIKGWHRTNTKADSFQVTEYSKSEIARMLPSCRAPGTISVLFSACWKEEEAPPADEKDFRSRKSRGDDLATKRGPEVATNLMEVRRHLGVVREAVTIRYGRNIQEP